MDKLLSSYTHEQQKVIDDYWSCLRFTRKTGRISDGIKRTELEYWSRYEPETVIKALEIHIDRYPAIREHYTRGIIRNLSASADKGSAVLPEYTQKPASKPKKSKFINFDDRMYEKSDFDVLEYLERLKASGRLDEMRGELKKDPKFAKFLI